MNVEYVLFHFVSLVYVEISMRVYARVCERSQKTLNVNEVSEWFYNKKYDRKDQI